MDEKIQELMAEAAASVDENGKETKAPQEKANESSAEQPNDAAESELSGESAKAQTNEMPEKLEKAQSEVNKLKDQLLRTAADFENYRKRSNREIEDAHRFGAQKILSDLLPVIDNLERALEHAPEGKEENYTSLREGLIMVKQQFLDTLKKHGVTPFDSKTQPFDPNIHEAISQIPSADVQSGHILEEMQRGYMYNERLLRPALVVVATALKNTEAEGENTAQDEAEQTEAAKSTDAPEDSKQAESDNE